jgi:hypothetical protein
LFTRFHTYNTTIFNLRATPTSRRRRRLAPASIASGSRRHSFPASIPTGLFLFISIVVVYMIYVFVIVTIIVCKTSSFFCQCDATPHRRHTQLLVSVALLFGSRHSTRQQISVRHNIFIFSILCFVTIHKCNLYDFFFSYSAPFDSSSFDGWEVEDTKSGLFVSKSVHCCCCCCCTFEQPTDF